MQPKIKFHFGIINKLPDNIRFSCNIYTTTLYSNLPLQNRAGGLAFSGRSSQVCLRILTVHTDAPWYTDQYWKYENSVIFYSVGMEIQANIEVSYGPVATNRNGVIRFCYTKTSMASQGWKQTLSVIREQ